jgi:hypothetical protein
VPQHVRVDRQLLEASLEGVLINQLPDCKPGERLSALRDEQKSRVRLHLLSDLEPRVYRAKLAIVQRLARCLPVLQAIDMDPSILEVDVGDFKLASFRYP